MDKQFMIKHVPPWMEHELDHPTTQVYRVKKATSLANHLVNNWEMTHPYQVEWRCTVCLHEQSYILLVLNQPFCESCGTRSAPREAINFKYTTE